MIHPMTHLPDTQQTDKEVVRETSSKHLGNDVNVGNKRTLEHDRHVRSIEQLYRVRPSLSPESVALDWNLDSKPLQVYNYHENHDCCNQIHHIWQPVTPESFPQCTSFVIPSEQ